MFSWVRYGRWSLAIGLVFAASMFFAVDNKAAAQAPSQTANYTVSVTVDNAFTLTETTPINFGTIAVTNGTTDTASLSMNGQTGVSTVTNGAAQARIIKITNGTPGVVSVTGAPPSTAMTIADPAAVTLSNPAQPTVDATFSADLTAVGLAFNSTTSATGTLTIQIGGVLSTVADASKTYSDATYTGTYTVTVSF